MILIQHKTEPNYHFKPLSCLLRHSVVLAAPFPETMPFAHETDGGINFGRSSFNQYDSICDRDSPEDDDSDSSDSSSAASSIGRNSDSSEEDSGEVEVQSSSFKGPLDTINDLEQDLPVKKGISKFYSGKSKSFTSLTDAVAAACVQEIVKPEDPYAKKRKNLLARNLLIGRSRSYADNVGGISKRMGRGASCLSLNEKGKSSTSISPTCPLPPLHPQANRSSTTADASLPRPQARNSPHRSYSWSDLHSSAEDHEISGLAICSGNKENEVH